MSLKWTTEFLPSAACGQRQQSWADASDRRAVRGLAVLGLAADGRAAEGGGKIVHVDKHPGGSPADVRTTDRAVAKLSIHPDDW